MEKYIEMIRELAGDLLAEINGRYGNDIHPSMLRKYKNDIDVVERAYELLKYYRSPSAQDSVEPTIDKPAKVAARWFHVGSKQSDVIEAAQRQAEAFPLPDTTGAMCFSNPIVYVCEERDIECGSNSKSWCADCPKHNQFTHRFKNSMIGDQDV